MTIIDFYDKPGCVGNKKQKSLLASAGHTVRAYSLLSEPWTPDRLREFFGDRPVVDWFNPTAPPIVSGQICPDQLPADEALTLMIRQPILIRRPLLQVGDRKMVGFDLAEINNWLGLSPDLNLNQDVQSCPQKQIA